MRGSQVKGGGGALCSFFSSAFHACAVLDLFLIKNASSASTFSVATFGAGVFDGELCAPPGVDADGDSCGAGTGG
jgi:hypothetical protein